jgi:hypothetical protein
MGSRQYLEEWQHYKNALDDSKVTERTTWLDVRGNHGKTAHISLTFKKCRELFGSIKNN